MDFKAHLFICTNSPENPEKCGSKNAENLRRRLKQRCGQKWGKQVRVNSSGCLGHCEEGIACVIYPQAQWFLNVTDSTEDEERLLAAVENVMIKNDEGTNK